MSIYGNYHLRTSFSEDELVDSRFARKTVELSESISCKREDMACDLCFSSRMCDREVLLDGLIVWLGSIITRCMMSTHLDSCSTDIF